MSTLAQIHHASQAGISSLLINPKARPRHDDKLHSCIRVAWHLRKLTDQERGVVVIFLDSGTPGGKTDKPGTLCLYRYIRDVLIALGEDPSEIAFIHDYPGAKRAQLESAARSGKIRYLLGSSAKLGVGTNIQDRLIAVLHLDFPLRPGLITQRDGRIARPGNRWTDALVIHFGTIDCRGGGGYDAWVRSTVSRKQKLASQLKSGAIAQSTVTDLGLTAADLEAQASLLSSDPEYGGYYQAKLQRQELSDRLRALNVQIYKHTKQLAEIPVQIQCLRSRRQTPKVVAVIAELEDTHQSLDRGLPLLKSQLDHLKRQEQYLRGVEESCHQAIAQRPDSDDLDCPAPQSIAYHGKPDPRLVSAILSSPPPDGFDSSGNPLDWRAIVQSSHLV